MIVSYDDHHTSTIAGLVARRLHRPFLDRTPPSEVDDPRSTDGMPSLHCDAALSWFDQTMDVSGQYVVAAPTILLDRVDRPIGEDQAWTVLLDEHGNSLRRADSGDVQGSRIANARRLSDISVDIGDGDDDRVVEHIASEWQRVHEAAGMRPDRPH